MKRYTLSLIAVLFSFTLNAEKIKITYPNWIDGIAVTHLAKAILEDKLGYEVVLDLAEPSENYASVASGDQDVYLNAWLPFTQSEYWKLHSLKLERLGTLVERAQIGLAVPDYMEIRSIAELADVADSIDGKIIGIEADSGTTDSTKVAIREYGLPLTLVNSSTDDMLAKLDAAIKAKEPIVVTAWTPHWMFARYDIKMLDDSSHIFIEDGIRKFARLGFTEDFPEAAVFLQRYSLTGDQINELLFAINKRPNEPETVVREWMAANAELVEAWIKPEKKGFFKKLFN